LPYSFDPIGFVRSPFTERAAAPRQAVSGRGEAARIELLPGRGYEHALDGLSGWDFAWVIFVFHRNVEQRRGWRAKVLPPRSGKRQGVFATRSPHRPNPIGLSAVEVVGVDGCVVHIRNVDLLDETPVLDLKPYVAYADARPGARAGWLEPQDPLLPWEVCFASRAREQLDWLVRRGVDLAGPIEAALSLGPAPHPYRRIRVHGRGMRLALKEWRVDFEVDDRRVLVQALSSGFRARERSLDPALELHRDFAAAWGE
jgi:tRNA-Thr(GGU) m(6)t(6)A37 methyltransferase TsaA